MKATDKDSFMTVMQTYIKSNTKFQGKEESESAFLLMNQFMKGLKSRLENDPDKLQKIILYAEVLMDILDGQGYEKGTTVTLGVTTTLEPAQIKQLLEMIRILSNKPVENQKEYLLKILTTIHQLLHSVPVKKTELGELQTQVQSLRSYTNKTKNSLRSAYSSASTYFTRKRNQTDKAPNKVMPDKFMPDNGSVKSKYYNNFKNNPLALELITTIDEVNKYINDLKWISKRMKEKRTFTETREHPKIISRAQNKMEKLIEQLKQFKIIKDENPKKEELISEARKSIREYKEVDLTLSPVNEPSSPANETSSPVNEPSSPANEPRSRVNREGKNINMQFSKENPFRSERKNYGNGAQANAALETAKNGKGANIMGSLNSMNLKPNKSSQNGVKQKMKLRAIRENNESERSSENNLDEERELGSLDEVRRLVTENNLDEELGTKNKASVPPQSTASNAKQTALMKSLENKFERNNLGRSKNLGSSLLGPKEKIVENNQVTRPRSTKMGSYEPPTYVKPEVGSNDGTNRRSESANRVENTPYTLLPGSDAENDTRSESANRGESTASEEKRSENDKWKNGMNTARKLASNTNGNKKSQGSSKARSLWKSVSSRVRTSGIGSKAALELQKGLRPKVKDGPGRSI
jgi:hypothetical protein